VRVFVVALDDIFLVTAVISLLGVLGALLLRSNVRVAPGQGGVPAEAAPPDVSIPSPRPAPEAGPLESARPAAVGADARSHRGHPKAPGA
jgi:hypothetical protein